ncbi:MAG: putative bifunctional diguanylate cyclase/phosphodiesterase [Prochlorococcaceae cyanobacterium]|jgi:diguanylate cyclase (GGDEF)-like protein
MGTAEDPPAPFNPLQGRVPIHAPPQGDEHLSAGNGSRGGGAGPGEVIEPPLRSATPGEAFRFAPQISGDDFVLFDPEHLRFLECNLSAHERLGYSREEFLALEPSRLQVNSAEDRTWLRNLAEQMLRRRHGSFSTQHRGRNKSVRDVLVRYLRVEVSGQPMLLLAFLDQTDQHRTDRELARVNQLLNQAEQLSHIGSWELIHSTGQLIWSDETARIFELDADHLPQTYEAFLELVHPEDRRKVHEHFQQSLLSGQGYEIQHRLLFNGGREKHVLERGQTTYDHKGWPLTTVGTVQDTTGIRELERQLEQVAYLDSLTGLPNRTATQRQLEEMLRQRSYSQNIALINLDLDHFDSVNETFGPESGNEVLRALAGMLRGMLEPDDWLARLGSDEFLVIRQRGVHSMAEAIALGRWLQERIGNGIPLGPGVPVQPTVCVGICTCPEHGSDVHGLLQSANTALMEAKRKGRNQLQVYSTSVSQRLRERLEMETQLDKALAREQLRLVYQPQLDRDGRVVGAEALVRWTNHQGVAIRPDQFIPLAEQTGQIHVIGLWVIETACSQIERWRLQGLEVPTIAVNVSAVQLEPRHTGLLEKVCDILTAHRIAPEDLELEITETALFTYRQQAVDQLRAFSAKGFQLALDDFGTGYSSLEMLHELELDRLKIDRCFVSRLGKESSDEAIVRTTILMAHELGMHSLAEGVETKEEFELLCNLGCEFFQGYLFDRPLEAQEFARRLASQAPSVEADRQAS